MLLCAGIFNSCDDLVLPEEGSIADATPPSASFSATPNEGNYQEISFTNLSDSATDYSWDFGDGVTSTEKNPSHTYTEDGLYTVTLSASDKLNVSDSFSKDVEIKEPEVAFTPVILNPSFDEQGDDDYRDGWRNGDLGGVIQITSSPVHTPEKAAKLPSDGSRIGYQLITVRENMDYAVRFYYTLKTDATGSITVAALAGDIIDPAAVDGATLASVVCDDQTDASTYVQQTLEFNSGDNTSVAIYFTNTGVEGRIDTFEIEEL